MAHAPRTLLATSIISRTQGFSDFIWAAMLPGAKEAQSFETFHGSLSFILYLSVSVGP